MYLMRHRFSSGIHVGAIRALLFLFTLPSMLHLLNMMHVLNNLIKIYDLKRLLD